MTDTDPVEAPGASGPSDSPSHPRQVESAPPPVADDPAPVDGGRPAPSPGERRLARPPSDRYREAEAAIAAAETTETVDPSASIARGVAVATAVAVLGAAAIVVFGGVLALTEVLLIVAGFTGGGVGLALRWGAAEHLARRRRVVIALAMALGAVALGQLGLWQYARIEGGVLGPLDYLAQVYGPLVLVEFAAAGVLAWLAAR